MNNEKQDYNKFKRNMLEIYEIERSRIASELHDNIGQRINAVKLGIEIVLDQGAEKMPLSSKQLITDAIENLHASLLDLRRITLNTKPPEFKKQSLVSAITDFCGSMTCLIDGTKFNTETNIEDSDIPDSIKIVIYRITQEGLNNICKHACAQNCCVSLTKVNGTIVLKISDDGLGFDMDSIAATKGYGLVSMRNRTELSGGNLTVKSMPEKGTIISAQWDEHKFSI